MDVLGVALGVLLGLAPVLRDAAVFFWLFSLGPENVHFQFGTFTSIYSSQASPLPSEGGHAAHGPITGKR